jgi:hypothetical protein
MMSKTKIVKIRGERVEIAFDSNGTLSVSSLFEDWRGFYLISNAENVTFKDVITLLLVYKTDTEEERIHLYNELCDLR